MNTTGSTSSHTTATGDSPRTLRSGPSRARGNALTLRTETLRSLHDSELARVVGGTFRKTQSQ